MRNPIARLIAAQQFEHCGEQFEYGNHGTPLLKCRSVGNRDQFWQKVQDTDSEPKIRALPRRQLQDYQKYFVQVRYDPTLPPHERDTASAHVTLLQREIDRRRNRWFAIAAIVIPILAAIGIAWWQIQASRQTSNSSQPSSISSEPKKTLLPVLSPTSPPTQLPFSLPSPLRLPSTTPTASDASSPLEAATSAPCDSPQKIPFEEIVARCSKTSERTRLDDALYRATLKQAAPCIEWELYFYRAERPDDEPSIMLVYLWLGKKSEFDFAPATVVCFLPYEGNNERLLQLRQTQKIRVRGEIGDVTETGHVRLRNATIEVLK